MIGGSADGRVASTGTSAMSTNGVLRGVRKFASMERFFNDALRRVTGLCVMSTGEIVLAAGSELRVGCFFPKK